MKDLKGKADGIWDSRHSVSLIINTINNKLQDYYNMLSIIYLSIYISIYLSLLLRTLLNVTTIVGTRSMVAPRTSTTSIT
jgi:hypothetical protein